MLKNLDIVLGTKNQPSVFHLYIHGRFKNKLSEGNNILKKKEAISILKTNMKKDMYKHFLDEMVSCGLIKLKDCQNILIL